MTVSASKFCYIHYGSDGGVIRTVIASKPLKGRAKVGELGRVIYQAPARYTDRDSFVYALHALNNRNVVRVVRINVAVNVTPEPYDR